MFKRVAFNRYCTGYKKSAFNHRSVENCGNWVKSVNASAKYFFFRQEGNYHCSPCPASYTGHPTTGTGYQNSKIYTYRFLTSHKPAPRPAPRPHTSGDKGQYKRVANNRYCTGYKANNMNTRSLTACANHIRKAAPEAKYFFYRHEGNHHCAACPSSYTGHPTTGTGHQNSKIYIYRIMNWRAPTFSWSRNYKRVAMNRYCTGYKKSAFNHRSVVNCAKWVRQVDPEARYFFFREEGNHHCSPCPQSYKGHATTGTGRQNSKIYTYRILNWTAKVYSWSKNYKRVANNRYCTGYKKSAFNHRSVVNCAKWVRQVDPDARYFFFREEGNYHCSPCPQSYKGHATSGTGHQNSRIYTYRILNWTAKVYSWSKNYKRVAMNRYCTGYKKSAFNHRTVTACAKWVGQVDREAKYFFFREEGNYHCSPCPQSYTGHPTTGTGHQNSRIYTYKILNFSISYNWSKDYKRVAMNRYCTGYKKSAFNHRSVIACGNWVKSVNKNAQYFFFREEGNYHCSPCP